MTREPTPSVEPSESARDSEVVAVLAAYAAFERGDIDTAVADLAPDVQWTEPEEFPNGGTYRGPVAVAAYLRASRAMWREIRSRPSVSRRGARIVAIHHVDGTLVDGTPHAATVADVYTFHNGRVVTMHAYADPHAVPD